jgi:hypothetical protein
MDEAYSFLDKRGIRLLAAERRILQPNANMTTCRDSRRDEGTQINT